MSGDLAAFGFSKFSCALRAKVLVLRLDAEINKCPPPPHKRLVPPPPPVPTSSESLATPLIRLFTIYSIYIYIYTYISNGIICTGLLLCHTLFCSALHVVDTGISVNKWINSWTWMDYICIYLFLLNSIRTKKMTFSVFLSSYNTLMMIIHNY